MRSLGLWIVAASLLAFACQPVDDPPTDPVGTASQAYGEPQGGFPNWHERMLHVLTNRARCDPAADLAGCTSCPDAGCFTSALHPLEWEYDLNRVARFHATNLTDSGCGMMHNSPCTLVSNLGAIYPSTCDGSVSCACTGGAPCSGGTSIWDRFGRFGVTGGWRGENIAGSGDPFTRFYQWFWESTSSSTCPPGSNPAAGHRHNILSTNFTQIGNGVDGSYSVQDFWSIAPVSQKILAGAHYPQTGSSFDLRANWYDSAAPQQATVNIDGVCYSMNVERGSASNGTYLYNGSSLSGCHEYYFLFVDSGSQNVRYPDTGSFGINCASDWTSNEPPLGSGCPGGTGCGNSVIDPGETCDPPATCPTDCDDGNDCTTDSMAGSPATCDVVCSNPPIVACSNGDSCCPTGCNANNDDDCSSSCGNDVVEPGETCDPPATCPTSCDDGNSCTVDTLTGSAANCNAACTFPEILTCTNGDSCCPGGCNANDDDDCSSSCGNDVVEPGETCDPPSSCPTSCDDGNSCTVDTLTGSAANCNAACSNPPIVSCADGDGCCPAGCDANVDDDCSASCGNDVVEPGETCDPPSSCPTSCDDGNSCTVDTLTGSAANCNAACSNPPIVSCADGDGCCPAGCDANVDDDCSASCGNDVVEPGETCDPPSSCPTSCDDGNSCTVDALTGSAANCNAACSNPPIVSCADGDSCCPAGCDANVDDDCSASCGNDVVEPGETCDPPSSCPTSCDDGNNCTLDTLTGSAANCNAACGFTEIVSCADSDGCCPAGCDANVDDDCSASCGNDIVEPGEACDPPASCPTSCNDGNGCTVDTLTGSAANCNAACSFTEIISCADADGCCPAGCDANGDDDCSASCGNDVVEPGETCDPETSCPADCDDQIGCTVDTLTGSAANCNAACSFTEIVSCGSGDGCCPAGCDPATDDDCSTTCGDGSVDAGETCDPQSSCPTDCDDSQTCTLDNLTGSAANCNAACSFTTIVTCADGDACCPVGCDLDADADCTCDNGVVEPHETCDPPDTCPTECVDTDPCTLDTLAGAPERCNVTCTFEAIAACSDGDGCCPAGCLVDNDSDCGGGDGGLEGSCNCRTGPARPAPPWLLLLGLAVVGLRLRRYVAVAP